MALLKLQGSSIGTALLPGIQAIFKETIEKQVRHLAEQMVRDALDEACKNVLTRVESMELWEDRTLVLNLYVDNELTKTYKNNYDPI